MFRFKQFSIEDDRSTMKVGTDAVLLGAFQGRQVSNLPKDGDFANRPRILDVGTGCGLIALMLAQSHPQAHIDAIDIDAPSVAQAAENFARSPWPGRLRAIHTSLQDYQAEAYDLIVTNPPYFTSSLKNPDPRRAQARHSDTLPLPDLLFHARRLLTAEGFLSLILPLPEARQLLDLAPAHGLYLHDSLLIQNRTDLPPKRRLLTLSADMTPKTTPIFHPTLILTTPQGTRTPAHQALTEAYYL